MMVTTDPVTVGVRLARPVVGKQHPSAIALAPAADNFTALEGIDSAKHGGIRKFW